MQINSCDLLLFSIPAHTRVPDCSRLTHIPSVHTPYLRGYWRAPCLVPCGTVWVKSKWGSLEIVWDDGINNCDLPLCYPAVKGAETSVTLASGLPESGPLLSSPRANCPRGRMEQGSSWKCENTHRIYNRKTHTNTKPTYSIWHPLLSSYQAASVSWSSRLPNSIESCGRNMACAVQPSCYS